MGRLFQYNRFGVIDKNEKKLKTHAAEAAKCASAYCEVYPEAEAAATTTATTAVGQSKDFALRKCQQWTSKLLSPALTATSQTASLSSSTNSNATSGYHSQREPNATATATATSTAITSKTCKVYDSMKSFLRRKLAGEVKHEMLQEQSCPTPPDHDEDISQQTHVECDDDTDCCSCYTDSETRSVSATPITTQPKATDSPQKSLLSFNCWRQAPVSSQEDDSSDCEMLGAAEHSDDSNAADCCQLILCDKSDTPKPSPLRVRYNVGNDDDDADADDSVEHASLLACAWYQPCMNAKGAFDYLENAAPGSFILRRMGRRHELCLRSEQRVLQYTVICTKTLNYKLKGARKEFSTLKALITHHSVMAEQLPLPLALPREQRDTKAQLKRRSDDFVAVETLRMLGVFKTLQVREYEI